MPINNIPGVGPTNADIATAVAAPSAATIAAAVAAPSAATIAAAVAAPSSATIATAVAAAVPTLAQINTSVATNAPSPNAWTLLGTGSLNNVTTATVSFSAYKKLRITFKIVSSGAITQTPYLRFNSDSTNNYLSAGYTSQTGTGGAFVNIFNSYPDNKVYLASTSVIASNSNYSGVMEINNADTTAGKSYSLSSIFFNGAYYKFDSYGQYFAGSAITSVTVLDNGLNTFANTANNNNAFQIWGQN